MPRASRHLDPSKSGLCSSMRRSFPRRTSSRLLALVCISACSASDSPLHYPAPPNPFATPKPPPSDPGLPLPPPGRGDLLPSMPPPAAAKQPRRSPFRLRWQPVVCMGLLSAVCVKTRPHEPLLLATLDAYHQQAAGVIDDSLSREIAKVHNVGLASVAVHSELVWLGILGAWLPLIPITQDAIAHWLPAANAPQLIISALTLGYLLRKLLPRSIAEGHLSVSFSNLAQLRIWTLVTAALSPVGLVHLFHSVVVLLVVMPSLSASLSRPEQLLLYLAAGLASSLSVSLGGVLLRRRSQPRVSVSAAVMGVVLMSAAVAPDEPVVIGEWGIPVLRAAVIHVLLDAFSNTGGSVEKLFGMLGAAVLVAVKRPQLRDLLQSGSWEGVLNYIKAAI
ncbi:hypothetical protein AB1Y20_001466 [Prymnesium parvum]|uniref:Peptidase S54 rhomboid domain-containing protein n=1 Tax=Prymnesium parvum TaxID=97485 RepID=A0AB34K8A7_PRYPA